MAESRHITYEKLRTLMGLDLTDRRLRQLAKEGHFPEPVDGLYDWVATMRGLLKYYKALQNDYAKRRLGIADEEHRKKKRENDEADKLLVRKADVVAEVRKIADPIRAVLRQKLENEYPLAVAGMEVPQARIYGKRLEDDILAEWQKLFASLGI